MLNIYMYVVVILAKVICPAQLTEIEKKTFNNILFVTIHFQFHLFCISLYIAFVNNIGLQIVGFQMKKHFYFF